MLGYYHAVPPGQNTSRAEALIKLCQLSLRWWPLTDALILGPYNR
jgi:hypothetical protein